MDSRFKNPDETDEDFMKRVLRTADEMGIKYKKVEAGQGGMFIELPDGTERRFTFEDLWNTLLSQRKGGYKKMQIRVGAVGNRRVDFYGNSIEGIYIELVNDQGETYHSQKITEEERLRLIDTLTRKDNGKSV